VRVKLINTTKELNNSDTIIIFVNENEIKGLSENPFINEYIKSFDLNYFYGKFSEIYFIKLNNRPGLILCGIGDPQKLTNDNIRNAAAASIKFCISKKVKKVTIVIPEIRNKKSDDLLKLIAEGALLSNYLFTKYMSDKDIDMPVEDIDLFISDELETKDTNLYKNSISLIKDIEIVVNNIYSCRDLVNDTTNAVNPVTFSELAKEIASKTDIKCTVLEKDDIEKRGMGLLLAVNKGSEIPPRIVILEYNGDSKNKKLFGLAGKGITFDSGGMDLKPPASMETMRCDMAGAAAVLFAMKSLAELKVKKNIAAVIPLTENMLSNNAFRPGDILIAANGLSVEVGNTDAEGRLILADALSLMIKEIKPDVIVDIATLTGSCVATFGETVAAYLSNDEKISDALKSASERTGEKIWRLPFFDDYDDRLKSDIADLNNVSSEKNAGAIVGALFLKKFIDKTTWAHIDIAGTAWYSKARGYNPKSATGFGVRLLVDLIKNWK